MALTKYDANRINLAKIYEYQEGDVAAFCKGDFFYYHYGCDGVDDRGWGCGYRTLQTLISWAKCHNKDLSQSAITSCSVPNIEQIQSKLVQIEDQPNSFLHSKQWIGSVEICLCLDVFCDMPCKIMHIEKGSMFDKYLKDIFNHFDKIGAPIMMGGETDNSSKGIIGIRLKNPALLIADPHYFGSLNSAKQLLDLGYVRWLPISELHADSFYNLCLPLPNVN
ncbi:putative Ufm1-specific protease 1 [Bulinus truncatus]|nr:putative Ufm1-specific protease 1 [Bulinus truncatus]